MFGNSTGGWRGAVLAGVVAGLMLSFGQALTVGCLPTTIADFARWSNDFDYSVFTWPFQQLLKLIFLNRFFSMDAPAAPETGRFHHHTGPAHSFGQALCDLVCLAK